MKFLEEWREWRLLPGRFYANDLVFCGELEEDLRPMMGRLVEVCIRGLKVNVEESRMMVVNGEQGLKRGAI